MVYILKWILEVLVESSVGISMWMILVLHLRVRSALSGSDYHFSNFPTGGVIII